MSMKRQRGVEMFSSDDGKVRRKKMVIDTFALLASRVLFPVIA